jgi:hypothetical protein
LWNIWRICSKEVVEIILRIHITALIEAHLVDIVLEVRIWDLIERLDTNWGDVHATVLKLQMELTKDEDSKVPS